MGEGIIRYIDVHDINEKPDLANLQKALRDLQQLPFAIPAFPSLVPHRG